MKNKLIIAAMLLLGAFLTRLNAQDWPQYLGPGRNSKSPEKGILRTWPESGPEVLWTADIGIGYGGPVIVVAYNKTTGDIVWKTPNLGNETYVSPTVVKIDGKDHIVMVTSSTNPIGHPDLPKTPGNIVGIEPLTGKILWNYNGWSCHITVPSAVDAGNNKVLITGGYELGALMIEVKKQADGSYVPTEVFRTVEFGEHTKPPLLIDGYFYAQYSTNSRRDGLVCMSMGGKVKWKTGRAPVFDKGSMISVDGLIIATDGAKNLYLIEPDTSGFKPLAKAEILGSKSIGDPNSMAGRIGGPTQNWAPIALADGKLLIRDQSRLMCVKVAQ